MSPSHEPSPALRRAPAVLAWSGGKDSTLALERLRGAESAYDVVALLTTVTAPYDRVSMHGIRRVILHAQAARLGLPVFEAAIPAPASNAAYESAFLAALERARDAYPLATTVAFGDLFLDDVRAYRERMLAGTGWTPAFPLWGEPTAALARGFVERGHRAILTCVDTEQLSAGFAGRDYDAALLSDLPGSADPCGERGEFHTCVVDSPLFASPITVARGERVLRDGRFQYADLVLASGAGEAAARRDSSPAPLDRDAVAR